MSGVTAHRWVGCQQPEKPVHPPAACLPACVHVPLLLPTPALSHASPPLPLPAPPRPTVCRMAAVKALTAFRDKWGKQYKVYVPQGERLEYHEYIALLKQSKLVLSPWGWGEWSHKVGSAPTACPAAML